MENMEKLPQEVLEYEQIMKNIIDYIDDNNISDKELEKRCEETYIKFQVSIWHTYSDFEKSWEIFFKELKEKRLDLYEKMTDDKFIWLGFKE